MDRAFRLMLNDFDVHLARPDTPVAKGDDGSEDGGHHQEQGCSGPVHLGAGIRTCDGRRGVRLLRACDPRLLD
jgi:hypothetical protein